jgi:hypothetical protein
MTERFSIHCGDCLDWLKAQPADSVDLVFGSPLRRLARRCRDAARRPVQPANAAADFFPPVTLKRWHRWVRAAAATVATASGVLPGSKPWGHEFKSTTKEQVDGP